MVDVRFKNLFGVYLCRQSTLVLEVQPYLFVFNSATFGASVLTVLGTSRLFLSFGAIFVVGVRFKNIFGTYILRQSTLVLEICPSFFVFISAKFVAFLHFLGLFGLFLGLGLS